MTPFQVAWAAPARRALRRLPEKVATAVVEFAYGSLWANRIHIESAGGSRRADGVAFRPPPTADTELTGPWKQTCGRRARVPPAYDLLEGERRVSVGDEQERVGLHSK